MKFVNSIKYINSFEKAPEAASISQKRIRDLCSALGRVNLGIKYISLPKCTAGHACAIMLESVIKTAGYKVGRITSVADFDPRASVYIDRELANIDDFNKCVAEIRAYVKLNREETFYKEEIVFALSLLLCKLSDCVYVILEGLSDKSYSIDAICAPYDLIIMPTVYGTTDAAETIRPQCEAIRRGTREVISGNQKSEIYNTISNACAMSGVRLYIPVKSQFSVTELSSRKLAFEYGGKDGYLLRSPSRILRDCAMTVIEASLAIRRDGVKLPWNAISQGLAAVTDTACFDMISLSPVIIADAASNAEEIGLLLKTCDDVGIKDKKFSVCVKCASTEELDAVVNALDGIEIDRLMLVSNGEILADDIRYDADEISIFKNTLDASKDIYSSISAQKSSLLCLGSLDFAISMKAELVKLMSF